MEKRSEQYAPLCLRLIIGFGAMAHGWAKLSHGPTGFKNLLVQIGVPFPHFNSWAVPIIEIVGGFAIFVGGFISIAAFPLIVTMLTAIITVHFKNGFSSVKTIGLASDGPIFGPIGYEINLLYIAGLLSLILTGAGKYSVDYLIFRRKRRKKNYL